MPHISIVIPAYNNAHLLPRCLDSITSQTFNDWEAVIVNDASSDDTARVAHEAAAGDSRIVVIDKPENGGTHLARKTGIQAVSGNFALFLDADDELAGPDVLERLACEALLHPADIIRFGLVVAAEQGTPEKTARLFEEWSNTEVQPGLTMDEIMEGAFSPARNWVFPWHITHRLFKAELAKQAFSVMADERLDRGEDAYEYFVMASMAQDERTCNGIKGYLYHMGVGATNVKALSAETYVREMRAHWNSSQVTDRFARLSGRSDLVALASGLKAKLVEAIGNDLNEKVSDADRPAAEEQLPAVIGVNAAAVEFWRFVRDRSWRYLVDDFIPAPDDELFRLENVARTYSPSDASSHKHNQHLAEKYLHALRKRMRLNEEQPRAQIFVSTHRQVDEFESDILRLVQVGAKNAGERFWNTLHDDDGENISELNPYYCELTTQYWAWKNVDADYYGFCHYRRYFNFSEESYQENRWGEVMETYIDEQTQRKYALDDETIRSTLERYDIITTKFESLKSFTGNANTPLAHWHEGENLKDADFENMLTILLDRHPDYADDVMTYCRGNRSFFCNMFIMRKKDFFEYCEWLFPLLEEFMNVTDFAKYSKESARTPGHLSERLLNIFLTHKARVSPSWRHKELQCVHFTEPMHSSSLEKISEWNAGFKPIVPVVLAADDNYVPMLTTTIHSMLENASPECFYDIIVMTTNISDENQRVMKAFLDTPGRARVRFFSVLHLIKNYKLTTNNPHIGIETYYRFLIQDALPQYDKVVYLDSDLIVKGDVSKLFATEMGDNLIAAVRDVDYLGNLNMKDGERLEYSRTVLKMDNPYDYFQAGVLVLNTREIRKTIPVETWLEEASDTRYIYNDQDILNARCEGRVTFLDPAWNVMHNGCHRIEGFCCHAPADVFGEYLEARQHELVIHYAGGEKPWNTVNCDRRTEYWAYARETPFYEHLLTLFAHKAAVFFENAEREANDYYLMDEESRLRSLVDPLLPPGSDRREAVRSLVKKVIKRP